MKNFKSLFPAVSIVLLCFLSVWRSPAVDCLAQPFLQLTDAHQQLIQTLTQRIKDMTPAIQASPRWAQGIPPADKVVAASLEMDKSLALANKRAWDISTTTGLGELTAARYSEVLSSERVLRTTGDLEKAGSGVGRLHGRKGDAYTDQILDRQGQVIVRDTTGEGVPKTSLAAKGYTEVEMLHDVDRVLENPPDGMDTLLADLRSHNSPEDVGRLSELHSAAELRRRGETIESVATDQFTGRTPDLFEKDVDFLTDQAAYSNKATINAFNSACDTDVKIEDLAQSIIDVESRIAPRKYRFCGSELTLPEPGTGPYNGLQAALANLNTALALKGSSRRFSIQNFTDDFHNLPWVP